MPVYKYQARAASGQTTGGSLIADSPSHAAAELRAKGLWPTEVRELTGAAARKAEQALALAAQPAPPPAAAPAAPAAYAPPGFQPPPAQPSPSSWGAAGGGTIAPTPYQPGTAPIHPQPSTGPPGVQAAGYTQAQGAYQPGSAPHWPQPPQAPAGQTSNPRQQAAVAARNTRRQQGNGWSLRRVREDDLALFFNQLGTMLNAGMGMHHALDMLANPGQAPNVKLRGIAREMADDLLQGSTLSQAMMKHPAVFKALHVYMVRAGEASGALPEILLQLSVYMQKEYEMRQDISRRTLYPKLVLGLLILVWPINAPLNIPNYLSGLFSTLLFAGSLLLGIYLLVQALTRTEAGRNLWDQIKLATPLFGPLVRKLAAARFGRALAALYTAGAPLPQSVSMAGDAAVNYSLRTAAHRAVPALQAGAPLSTTLAATHFFPPMFIGMLTTGEMTGSLDTMLVKAADFFEEEGRTTMAKMAITLGVMVLIFVAIIVLIKLISFYTGMITGLMGRYGE